MKQEVNRGIRVEEHFKVLPKEAINRIIDMVDLFWIKPGYVDISQRRSLVEKMFQKYAKLGCAQLSANPKLCTFVGNYVKISNEKELPSHYSTIVDGGQNLYVREGFGRFWSEYPEMIISMLEKYWINPGYISNEERWKLIEYLLDKYKNQKELVLSTNIRSKEAYVGTYVNCLNFPRSYSTTLNRNGLVVVKRNGRIVSC